MSTCGYRLAFHQYRVLWQYPSSVVTLQRADHLSRGLQHQIFARICYEVARQLRILGALALGRPIQKAGTATTQGVIRNSNRKD